MTPEGHPRSPGQSPVVPRLSLPGSAPPNSPRLLMSPRVPMSPRANSPPTGATASSSDGPRTSPRFGTPRDNVRLESARRRHEASVASYVQRRRNCTSTAGSPGNAALNSRLGQRRPNPLLGTPSRGNLTHRGPHDPPSGGSESGALGAPRVPGPVGSPPLSSPRDGTLQTPVRKRPPEEDGDVELEHTTQLRHGTCAQQVEALCNKAQNLVLEMTAVMAPTAPSPRDTVRVPPTGRPPRAPPGPLTSPPQALASTTPASWDSVLSAELPEEPIVSGIGGNEEKEVCDLRQRVARTEKELDRLRGHAGSVSSNEEIALLRKQVTSLQAQLDEARSEIQEVRGQIRQLTQRPRTPLTLPLTAVAQQAPPLTIPDTVRCSSAPTSTSSSKPRHGVCTPGVCNPGASTPACGAPASGTPNVPGAGAHGITGAGAPRATSPGLSPPGTARLPQSYKTPTRLQTPTQTSLTPVSSAGAFQTNTPWQARSGQQVAEQKMCEKVPSTSGQDRNSRSRPDRVQSAPCIGAPPGVSIHRSAGAHWQQHARASQTPVLVANPGAAPAQVQPAG